MSSSGRREKELMMKSRAMLDSATEPLETLRLQCLARGCNGIQGIGRIFRIIDDDGSKQLNFEEFAKGIHDFGLTMEKSKLADLFKSIDVDNSGSICYEEFLRALRPPMSKTRVDLIKKAFQKLDKSGDGTITIDDLKGVYNVKHHPKYLNGEKTEAELFKIFLDTFGVDKDGVVTVSEFEDYYAGVSASIDDDAYFDLMMRRAWKIE